VLISDEFTDPHKRQAIMERRGRKMDGVLPLLDPPRFTGPDDAEVTLLGWGSTEGVIDEAVEQLAAQGIVANHLQIRWLVPLQSEAIAHALSARAPSSWWRTTTAASSPVSTVGDRHRGGRAHPQVRRRAFPAPPRGEWREEDPRRRDQKYVPVHEIRV